MEPEDTTPSEQLKFWPKYTDLKGSGTSELAIKLQNPQIVTVVHATYKFGYYTLFFEHPFILLTEKAYYSLKWVTNAATVCNQPIIANQSKEDENYTAKLASVVSVLISYYSLTHPS